MTANRDELVKVVYAAIPNKSRALVTIDEVVDAILSSEWLEKVRAREHREGYRVALADAAHDLEVMRDFDSHDQHTIRQRLLNKARRRKGGDV